MLLDNLYKDKYIIFLDIEFQNFQPKNQQEHHILEIGVLIFERGNEDPILVEHINFPMLNLKNMRLMGIEYSNVSEKTEKEMENIQEKFIIKSELNDIIKKEKLIKYIPNKDVRNKLKEAIKTNNSALIDADKDMIEKHAKKAMFLYFYNRLPNEYKKLLEKQHSLYKNDSQVKKRLVDPVEYLKKLNLYLKDGILIHKETTDLEALRNASQYYNIPLQIKNKFDIAIFNNKLSKVAKSPNLHNSYLYLYDEKIKKNHNMLKYHDKLIDLINKKMPKFRPHNPLVDAFMTIFVYVLLI
jgi:hypothetical protein